jgi:putative ABC transport system permease protein
MTHILRDLKHGIRLLIRKPGFTVVALVTLALGMGANTAIFTVAHALILKPLPYSNPDELVIVNENNFSRGWKSFSVSALNFIDWRAQTSSFAALAAYGSRSVNYSGSGTPERLRVLAGTQGFLEMLDGTPEQGRGFLPEEFEPGKSNVVILGHGFWERAFGSQDVRNQTIVLNGQPYTIVGVMHPNWRFAGRDTPIFTPRSLGPNDIGTRGGHSLAVVGRLKPGVSVAAAQSELSALASRLAQQYPDTNTGWGVGVTSLFDAAVGGVRPMIAILLGAVGVVLLVACANLANMHLARATGRAREMAIRAAIGAGRWRLTQQLLAESAVLAAVGGALGLLLAYWATTAFVAAYPALLPRTTEIHVDATVLAFTAVLSMVTAALFGLAPAIAAARVRFNQTLKDGARGGGPLRRFLRHALVVTEVALALILLAGAGLLLRSFVQLAQVDPGFQIDHRLTATTFLPRPKYAENPRMVDFFDRAMSEVRAIPGVEQVALASLIPISGNDELYSIDFDGRPPLPAGQGVSALYYLVSPEYFQTMGIRVLQGRGFTDQDRDGTPRVAVINDVFARLHYPNENPIGQHIRIGRNSTIVREIVGVVSSVKHYGLAEQVGAQMYEPFRQMPYSTMTFVIRTRDEPLGIVPAVKQALQRVDKDQPIATTASIEQLVSDAGALPRVQTILMAALGAITLLLAAVGLYGVMAYSVSQRTQEIGVRMTLGASRPAVLWMVLRQAAGLAAIGLAIGITGAIVMGRVLTSVLEPMLFQVTPVDAATLTGVSVLLAIVAIVAALIPARRATRIDPVQALRSF